MKKKEVELFVLPPLFVYVLSFASVNVALIVDKIAALWR